MSFLLQHLSFLRRHMSFFGMAKLRCRINPLSRCVRIPVKSTVHSGPNRPIVPAHFDRTDSGRRLWVKLYSGWSVLSPSFESISGLAAYFGLTELPLSGTL